MKTHDFASMSIDELWALHLEVTALLEGRIAAEKIQLEERLQRLQASGVSSGDQRRERRPYPQVFPKYRNPVKPFETWAGRGKQPRWLKAQLQSGKKIDDFRIRNGDQRTKRRSLKRR